jgi:hypothetical protein
MALSPVSLTLKQKIFVNSKILFYNNDEKTDMLLIYRKWWNLLIYLLNFD